MPIIILILATGYLLTIHVLLMVAQKSLRGSQSLTESLQSASLGSSFSSYLSAEPQQSIDETERQRATTMTASSS